MTENKAGKILVIDDDPGVTRFLKNALEPEGYVVLAAINGLQGLTIARQIKPDVVILDVMLPGIDGYEVCQRLKADSITRYIPVMMLSVKDKRADREIGERVGANEYLPKPVNLVDLLSTVETLVGS